MVGNPPNPVIRVSSLGSASYRRFKVSKYPARSEERPPRQKLQGDANFYLALTAVLSPRLTSKRTTILNLNTHQCSHWSLSGVARATCRKRC